MEKELTKQEQELQKQFIKEHQHNGSIEVRNIILSINPKYVKLIKNKKKRWEFRKQLWSNHKIIDKIYIYETSPVKKIIGYFTTDLIIKGTPEDIWNLCKTGAGITKWEFNAYFSKRSEGSAIKITKLHLFNRSIEPRDQIKGFHAPQNFMYVNKRIEELPEEEKKLDDFLGIRINRENKETLEKEATELGLSVAEYVREQLFGKINNVNLPKAPNLNKLNPPKRSRESPDSRLNPKTQLNSSMAQLSKLRQKARKRLIEEIKRGVNLEQTNYCKECKKRYSELKCPYCQEENEENKNKL
jgi:type I restriction enzyme S subunit